MTNVVMSYRNHMLSYKIDSHISESRLIMDNVNEMRFISSALSGETLRIVII